MSSCKLKENTANDWMMSDLESTAAGLMNNFNLLQQYPDLRIEPCIDIIELSFENRYFNDIRNSLVQEFGSYKPVKTKRGMVFKFYEPGKHDLTLQPQGNNWGRLFTLNQPTMDIQQRVNNCFTLLNISPNLSYIELATDFFTENLLELRDQLEATLYVKDKTGAVVKLDNSFYIGSRKKNSKVIDLYVKKEMGLIWVRLEVRLTQRMIKKLGLKFPVTAAGLNFGEFFSFKVFRADEVLKRELRFVNKQYTQDDLAKKLGFAILRSWMRGFLQREYGGKTVLMEKLDWLKNKENRYPRNPALYVDDVNNGQATIVLINAFWRSYPFSRITHRA
jgi:hypothetical protein